MATLREQFMSKSEERRVWAQKKAKAETPATCPYFSTPHGQPYRTNQQACGKPLLVSGQHGHLCHDHRLQQEAILESMRKNSLKPAAAVDADLAVVESILALEQRAIARGQVNRVRFGSCAFDPVYIKFWSSNA